MAGRSGHHKRPRSAADNNEGGPAEVDPNLALFASWAKEEKTREREEKAAARAERELAEREGALRKAKDDAAALVKRLRSNPSASTEEKAAADTAYRSALAAVVAAEKGEFAEPETVRAPGADATGESEAGVVADPAPQAEPQPSTDPVPADDEAQAEGSDAS